MYMHENTCNHLAYSTRVLPPSHLSPSQMRHNPELHFELDGPPRPWKEAHPSATSAYDTTSTVTLQAAKADPQAFLSLMRSPLDAYLQSSGLAPMGQLEWETYCEYAGDEFGGWREGVEEKLVEAGGSCFFNPRVSWVGVWYNWDGTEQSIGCVAKCMVFTKVWLVSLK